MILRSLKLADDCQPRCPFYDIHWYSWSKGLLQKNTIKPGSSQLFCVCLAHAVPRIRWIGWIETGSSKWRTIFQEKLRWEAKLNCSSGFLNSSWMPLHWTLGEMLKWDKCLSCSRSVNFLNRRDYSWPSIFVSIPSIGYGLVCFDPLGWFLQTLAPVQPMDLVLKYGGSGQFPPFMQVWYQFSDRGIVPPQALTLGPTSSGVLLGPDVSPHRASLERRLSLGKAGGQKQPKMAIVNGNMIKTRSIFWGYSISRHT